MPLSGDGWILRCLHGFVHRYDVVRSQHEITIRNNAGTLQQEETIIVELLVGSSWERDVVLNTLAVRRHATINKAPYSLHIVTSTAPRS